MLQGKKEDYCGRQVLSVAGVSWMKLSRVLLGNMAKEKCYHRQSWTAVKSGCERENAYGKRKDLYVIF